MHPHPFRPSAGAPTPYWLRLWVLLLLVPACFALVTMPMTMAAVALTLSFGLPLAVWLGMHVHEPKELPANLPGALRFGAGVSITALGLGGLFAFSATLGWATLVAYVATHALMFMWGKSPSAARPEPATTPPVATASSTVHEDETIAPVTSQDLVREMTDAEICHAWRNTFVKLQDARGLHLRAALVQVRQLLLDEIEARHPAGLQAWLASGARAAGGPDRFIDPKGGSGHPEAA